jgi:hypothetical protein
MGSRGPGARPKRAEVPGARNFPAASWQAPRLSRAQRVIRFCESLPITKGHLAGQTMKLLSEQTKFIREVYGGRGVKLAVLSAPRGNGKTGLLGLTLAHLLGPEAIPRGETYSAAIDRRQAAILYREMKRLSRRCPSSTLAATA